MSTRIILPAALGVAAVALVAAFMLSTKSGGTSDDTESGGLTVERVESGQVNAADDDALADALTDLGRSSDARAPVEAEDAPARTVATQGDDTNIDPAAARIVRVELRVPMGSPADPDLRVVGWSNEELDEENIDWTSESVRRRFRRRSSGASAIRTFAEAATDDEVRWSVATVGADGTIELAFAEDADEGLIQIAARYLYLAEPVEVDLASGVDRVVVEPEVGAWITGNVRTGSATVEPNDDGVFGTVALSGGRMGGGRQRGGWIDRRVDLDESLAFEFRGVRPDVTVTVHADIPTLAPGRSEALDLQPGLRTSCDVELALGGSIEGHALDDTGEPVAGATVRATGQRGMMFGQRGGREATSDDNGAFRLTGLAEGSYTVTGSLDDWRGGRSEERVEVQNASTQTGVEVRMTRGLEIVGRALLPDGSPAAGAAIRLQQSPAGGAAAGRSTRNPWGGGNRGPERRRTEAGADGTFRFSALAELPARIAASFTPEGEETDAADTLVAIAEDVTPKEPGEGDPIELQLEVTLTISGVVRDESGAPVSEFEVRAAREGFRSNAGAGDGVRETFTTEDGSFVLGGASEGSWRVSIAAEGHDSPPDQTLTVVVPQEGAPLAFTLTRQGGVRGIVVDPSGVPVAGATVRRVAGGGGGPFGQPRRGGGTETDDNGAFELANLTPGMQRFEATSDDWADSEPITVEVAAGLVTEGVVFELRQGGRITGVVNDGSGAPWEGRRVSYGAGGGPMAMFGGSETATTDASGAFTFEHVPPGKWTVNASPGEREMMATFQNARDESAFFDLMAQNLSKEVTVDDGEEVFVQLGAEPREPVIVFGEVTRGGQAIAGANVTFAREGGDLFANMKRGPAEGGSYRLELDRPGAYIVSVERGAKRNSFLVDVVAGEEQRVDLELPEGGIAGRIVDAQGEPAVGVRVAAEPRSAYSFARFDPRAETTDGEGHYEILDLDPGTYTLRVGGQGFGRGFGARSSGEAFGREIVDDITVTATEVTAGVDVRLSGAGRVIGTVSNAAGDPVAGASVFVREESGRPIDSISTVQTNAAGRFTYDRVAPGTYVVSARTDDSSAEDLGGVVVVEGQDTEVTLEVAEASTLVIRTVEDDDTPVRVQLSVTDSEGREVTGMVGTELFRSFGSGISTSEQRVGPLAPGRYTVTARAQDGRTKRKRVTVKGSKDTRVRVRFDPPED